MFPWWSLVVSANGMALAWYEAIYADFDRVWLLALAGGMIGILPASALEAWIRRNGT
jgi:hypothetical protein